MAFISHLKDPQNTYKLGVLLEAETIFERDCVEELNTLLAMGVDINMCALKTEKTQKDLEKGAYATPHLVSLLYYAIHHNAIKCLSELIKQKIEVNRADTFEAQGGTALMHIIQYQPRNYENIAQLLLTVPIDTTLYNMYQENIFHFLFPGRTTNKQMKVAVLGNILAQKKSPREWESILSVILFNTIRHNQDDLTQQIIDAFSDPTNLKQISHILGLNVRNYNGKQTDKFNQQVIAKIKATEDKQLLNEAINPKENNIETVHTGRVHKI